MLPEFVHRLNLADRYLALALAEVERAQRVANDLEAWSIEAIVESIDNLGNDLRGLSLASVRTANKQLAANRGERCEESTYQVDEVM